MRRIANIVLSVGLLAPLDPGAAAGGPGEEVRGITISCQTWGREWASDGFGRELDELARLGVNWVAIHPYARIERDGRVHGRTIDPDAPPEWITRPIREARERGMGILVKPHLGYWGNFAWRGEIEFEHEDERARFFREYGDWIVSVAAAARGAHAFAVGTELDRLIQHEDEWRSIVARCRAVSDARMTYAANWTDFERVPFWDALDAVGVQAYFPLSAGQDPARGELRAGWKPVLDTLQRVHAKTGKPVVFTELGYNQSLAAAREPWAHAVSQGAEGERARALQSRCYEVALEVLQRERAWLRGAFLWKWFVGEPGRGDGNFLVDTPHVRSILARFWR